MDPRTVDLIYLVAKGAVSLFFMWIGSRYVRDVRAEKLLSAVAKVAVPIVQELNGKKRELQDPAKPGEWNRSMAALFKTQAVIMLKTVLGRGVPFLTRWVGGEDRLNAILSTIVEGVVETTRPVHPSNTVLRDALLDESRETVPSVPPGPMPESLRATPGERPSRKPSVVYDPNQTWPRGVIPPPAGDSGPDGAA